VLVFAATVASSLLVVIYLLVLITRDRDATQQANERLRDSEERFRLTIEEAPIGMALVALDGRFVRVNRALCEIAGYSADELTTKTFQSITHPDYVEADVAAAGQLTRGDISRYKVEKKYVRKDGSTVDVQLSVSTLRSRGGTALYYISQIEDITERKRASEALRRAVAARDEMLRVVAHDLRNPLTSIIHSVQLAQRSPESGLTKRLELMSHAAKRMNALIQGLLDVSLIEAGQLKVECERLSTADLLREAVDIHASLAASSGLEICVKAPADAGDLWGNRERIHEVFEKLIGNAIKFTDKGGLISVGVDAREHDVLFSVTDTGRGMPPDRLAHVFDRFWQFPQGDRLCGGLGLPITKGIIEAQGGQIWAESTVGRGSTFFFTVPKATS